MRSVGGDSEIIEFPDGQLRRVVATTLNRSLRVGTNAKSRAPVCEGVASEVVHPSARLHSSENACGFWGHCFDSTSLRFVPVEDVEVGEYAIDGLSAPPGVTLTGVLGGQRHIVASPSVIAGCPKAPILESDREPSP